MEILGASGILKRGFVPVHTNVLTNVQPPFRTLFSHPITGLRTLWHDPVWSKVIATIIVGVFGVFGVYILRTPSTSDRADSAKYCAAPFLRSNMQERDN